MTRRFAGGRLVVATHNARQAREIAALLAPFPVEVVSAARSGCPSRRRPRRPSSATPGSRRTPPRAASGLPALADDSRHRGRRARRRARRPYRRLGGAAGGGRDFVQAMTPDLGASSRRPRAPEPRTARFRCTLVLAWPDGHDEVFEGAVEGRCVWPMRGDRGHGYDPMFLPDGHDADLRRDGPGREEPDQPPRRRLRAAGGGLLCLTRPRRGRGLARRRLRRLRPLAVLRRQVPLLRLQQPRPRAASTPARWRRALVAEIAAAAREVPGRTRRHRLLRRRHAEPDAAGDGGGGDRRRSARGWTLAPDAEITLEANPTSVEAGRFRGYRDAGVNRLSMGVQALDDARPAGARPDARRRRGGARLRGRAGDLPAGELRPDLRPPGPDARRLAGASSTGRWRWRSTTCRSTS